jgi:hypothetical protein
MNLAVFSYDRALRIASLEKTQFMEFVSKTVTFNFQLMGCD